VRSDADAGNPIVISNPESEPAQALTRVAEQIIAAICLQGVAQRTDAETTATEPTLATV
jgi:MinD-like ATPase involved in chromosome partitioning or flagellar assembly